MHGYIIPSIRVINEYFFAMLDLDIVYHTDEIELFVVSSLLETVIFSNACHIYTASASVPPAFLTKHCHISDPGILSRITRRERSNGARGPVWGADRRTASQSVPYPQTGRCPLSLRGRLLTRGEPGGCWNEETWELLRGWAGHLMSSTRAGCDAEWAEGERQPLQSVTKAQPDGQRRRGKYWADTPLLYFIYFVRGKWSWNTCRNLLWHKRDEKNDTVQHRFHQPWAWINNK